MWGSTDCCRQVIGVFPEVDRDVGRRRGGKGRRERRKALSRSAQREIKPDIWKWTAIYVHPVVSKHRKRTVGLKPLWGLYPPQNNSRLCISCALYSDVGFLFAHMLSSLIPIQGLSLYVPICISLSLFQHVLHCCHHPFPPPLSSQLLVTSYCEGFVGVKECV